MIPLTRSSPFGLRNLCGALSHLGEIRSTFCSITSSKYSDMHFGNSLIPSKSNSTICPILSRRRVVSSANGITRGFRFSQCQHFHSTIYDDADVPPPYEPSEEKPATVVTKMGVDLLHDPWSNKGTAFPASERDRLRVRGLLPPAITNLDLQTRRFMEEWEKPRELIPPEDVKLGGVTTEMARRWFLLQNLQDRNETLFYKVLNDNFVEMAPIVYTPTVGWVCVNYHKLYRRPRGMYFSVEDRGQMASMVYNWPQNDVAAIVVTDGSRILGLGDLGVNGLGIPIGKLDLYCAAAGFTPNKVLPVVIDVGTNNQELRDDPFYYGLRQPRIQGYEYYELIDEFVTAVMARWPNAVLQFEDFSTNHALNLLNRYRDHHLVFNDDIQGTAATALAGLYGALRSIGLPTSAISKQRVVCVGAGSAGMGVVDMIARGMEKAGGFSADAAARNFWILNNEGLITSDRPDLPSYVKKFARNNGESNAQGVEKDGESLLEVVNRVKPTILLGLAGAGRLFTKEVITAMNKHCVDQRPIIFPMSNPTSKMECTNDEALRWTNGRVLFASGSPQPPVSLKGHTWRTSQANNMYIFPGVALGAWLGETRTISEAMLMRAAEVLPTLMTADDINENQAYPKLNNIREISAKIALEVIKEADKNGQVHGKAAVKLALGDAALMHYIKHSMYNPQYASLVHRPEAV